MRKLIKAALRRFGYDLVRFDPSAFHPRVSSLLRGKHINLALDVGAHLGSSGSYLRHQGYRGRIISIEPTNESHEQLKQAAQGDEAWDVWPRMAIGDHDGHVIMNVAQNLVSSSTLAMLEDHVSAAPDSRYVRQENAELHTLDTAVGAQVGPDARVFLKLDVQGAEAAVLAGSQAILPRVQIILMELSFVPLYEGQGTFGEMLRLLEGLGFCLCAVTHGFQDSQTGRLLQIDGLFTRS